MKNTGFTTAGTLAQVALNGNVQLGAVNVSNIRVLLLNLAPYHITVTRDLIVTPLQGNDVAHLEVPF